ncbi:DUF1707 domain-containing protein [Actinoplanes sp. NPDC051470]|uniref:DUF1707 domain-containing protein n=1 Tax=Actinoplanes sp. NPDC051470 TaxID=3157224 RepID=UPI0034445BCE
MASDEIRAADADRQQVAERLRAALDEGRLDLHEYDDRLQQTYSAKTYGELERLTTDLPMVVTATPVAPKVDGDLTRRWLIHVWDEYVTAVGICVAIWVLAGVDGDWGFFWPLWVAGPWGVILVWQTISGLSNDEPRKWHAKNERKKLKKEQKRERKELDE